MRVILSLTALAAVLGLAFLVLDAPLATNKLGLLRGATEEVASVDEMDTSTRRRLGARHIENHALAAVARMQEKRGDRRQEARREKRKEARAKAKAKAFQNSITKTTKTANNNKLKYEERNKHKKEQEKKKKDPVLEAIDKRLAAEKAAILADMHGTFSDVEKERLGIKKSGEIEKSIKEEDEIAGAP